MKEIIKVKGIKTVFGDKIVHDGLNLSVNKGEIYGILGPSGCGKTTLLRQIVMLEQFQEGTIEILEKDLNYISLKDAQLLRQCWGVLFQFGALFSSLTIGENIALPLKEYTDLNDKIIKEIIEFKIHIVGLKFSDISLYPSQISGGMKKKAGLARALALDPKLLFLDEPTSGLDPISARDFDKLILNLRDLLGLTIVMVSHDLKSIHDTSDRFAVIDNKKIIYEGSFDNIDSIDNRFINNFFQKGI
ncbi:ABC transporter ATP-binding protein [Halarcobacter anaerophilus]|uniref:Sulfate ABC transporter ATP-binding protein n=1 Tax=Halarcobacter anaerophilus TaxID=877500 RepID=A0A4Q0Y3J5_9BACT|nr:ATP-binding cassette domain-containing protein [Halarcobacter anaerophilus]QDF29476.1 lipid asymmetry ABC transporter MlaABCDEF, ATPase component MlaF [Halarcobacter anaerophilus]RXJ64717.1 sulfate ABC transporter ATP-binding protein [Halarcobacter anaerophilus]